MTRRDFLKQLRNILLGFTAIYISRAIGFFKKPSSPHQPKHPAKYYHESDDLAG